MLPIPQPLQVQFADLFAEQGGSDKKPWGLQKVSTL